jgi:hypothetical protein
VNKNGGLSGLIKFQNITIDVPNGNHDIFIQNQNQEGPLRLTIQDTTIIRSGAAVPVEVDANGGLYSPFGGMDLGLTSHPIKFLDNVSHETFIHGFLDQSKMISSKWVLTDVQGNFTFNNPPTGDPNDPNQWPNYWPGYATITNLHISIGQNP